MSNAINFNHVTKRYLTVTFADVNNTVITVSTPTKALFQDLIELARNIGTRAENNLETIDELYIVCAKIMSRNKEGVEITKEFMEENMDFEDIITFFKAYMAFVREISKLKN